MENQETTPTIPPVDPVDRPFDADLTLKEFGEIVGISYPTVRKLCNEGIIACRVFPGLKWARIPRSEADRLLAESRPRRWKKSNGPAPE